MSSWKDFDSNAVTHSAAHHLVAIAELRDEFGYARVSDVARALEITRGSVSVTLKGLKQRGLVTEDDRRFLGLSEIGERIARSVQARKKIMKRLFVDAVGVDKEQADVDTCKIEHLVSNRTAAHATRFVRFLQSDVPEAVAFRKRFASFDAACDGSPQDCPCCTDVCLASQLSDRPDSSSDEKAEA